MESLRKRFETKVLRADEDACWEWIGAKNGLAGYGVLWDSGRLAYAHRISYELFVGRIPAGWQVHHECGNPSCVNPKHLRAMTSRQNLLLGDGLPGRNSRKTHCPRGHEYTDRNTYINKSGGRQCRQCAREKARWRYRENVGLPVEDDRDYRSKDLLRVNDDRNSVVVRPEACPHGHPYTPDNVYLRGKYRVCRTCAQERSRENYWRSKQNR